ncbi:hypothetical protein CI610_03463 [invertebrate metagenome]|uniref:Uncharacterized protein n=1 Tax=invertebrate metagenome TaxID=1711999 RepID=A0A2H9T335_9ZZZZ
MSRPGDRTQSLLHMGERSTKGQNEALSRETLGRRKFVRKKRKDKIPNSVASYDHAMGAAGTIITPYLQGRVGGKDQLRPPTKALLGHVCLEVYREGRLYQQRTFLPRPSFLMFEDL